MITYQQPDPAVKIVLSRQKLKSTESYRWIRYCVTAIVPEGTLCYNVLTKEMVLLTREDFQDNKKAEENAEIQPEDLTAETFRCLAEHWFLVPAACREEDYIGSMRSTVRLLNERRNQLSSYTILPTTECNARCYYCYEKGMEQHRMTETTARDVADFVRRTSAEKFLIRWFGGEPLCNAERIDFITEQLSDRDFTSSMVSNSYLFNESMAARAVSQWHLKKIQITLDGTDAVYNQVKHYNVIDYNYSVNPFRRVIRNIHLLAEKGVKVTVRLNLGKNNYENLVSLVHFLGQEFAGEKNLKVYAAILFQFYMDPEQQEQLKELSAEIKESGLLQRIVYPGSFRRIRYHYCMADSKNSILINPYGGLARCDLYCDELCGNIHDGITEQSVYDSWNATEDETPDCKSCPVLPDCIRLTRCPGTLNYHHQCPEFGDIGQITEKCREMMIRTYQKKVRENKQEVP